MCLHFSPLLFSPVDEIGAATVRGGSDEGHLVDRTRRKLAMANSGTSERMVWLEAPNLVKSQTDAQGQEH
jgi:hypothetical protein